MFVIRHITALLILAYAATSMATDAQQVAAIKSECGSRPWPVAPTSSCGGSNVTSPYGCSVTRNATNKHCHKGLDLGACVGTPIVAVCNGTITWNNYTSTPSCGGGEGCAISLTCKDGTGYIAGYAHLTAGSALPTGANVTAGQEIGRTGNSGSSEGPHLHFMMCKSSNGGNPFGACSTPSGSNTADDPVKQLSCSDPRSKNANAWNAARDYGNACVSSGKSVSDCTLWYATAQVCLKGHQANPEVCLTDMPEIKADPGAGAPGTGSGGGGLPASNETARDGNSNSQPTCDDIMEIVKDRGDDGKEREFEVRSKVNQC